MEVTVTDSPASAQAKLQELGESYLQALRNNAQALSQANAKVTESWMQLFSGGAEAATPKTKAT